MKYSLNYVYILFMFTILYMYIDMIFIMCSDIDVRGFMIGIISVI